MNHPPQKQLRQGHTQTLLCEDYRRLWVMHVQTYGCTVICYYLQQFSSDMGLLTMLRNHICLYHVMDLMAYFYSYPKCSFDRT